MEPWNGLKRLTDTEERFLISVATSLNPFRLVRPATYSYGVEGRLSPNNPSSLCPPHLDHPTIRPIQSLHLYRLYARY